MVHMYSKAQQTAWKQINDFDKKIGSEILIAQPAEASKLLYGLILSSSRQLPRLVGHAIDVLLHKPLRTSINQGVILIDVDGVLVDWITPFREFMKNKQHKELEGAEKHYNIKRRYQLDTKTATDCVIEFNHTQSIIENLQPQPHAVETIWRLHEKNGFVFHAITCVSDEPSVHRWRRNNIENLFGRNAFEEIICLNFDGDKQAILSEYAKTKCFWLEDNIDNAIKGALCGLRSVLFDQPYNQTPPDPLFERVSGWDDFYHSHWNEFYALSGN